MALAFRGNGVQSVRMGAYDPYGTFSGDPKISIEHIFIPWQDVNLASLSFVDQYARERGRSLLITVEPWTWSHDKAQTPGALFAGIIAGTYDHLIRDLCQKSALLKSEVVIRWGHEMDLGNDRYPWSAWTPTEYVQAYRHFVGACRAAGNGRPLFMWSPRGEPSLRDYYPGSEYVDSIGLTMFGFQKYEIALYGRALSFAERLGRSYELVVDYAKDIYIAEFGCHGDRGYMKSCLDEARSASATFSSIRGVIYFNEVETYPWPGADGVPDWRVMSKLFAELPR